MQNADNHTLSYDFRRGTGLQPAARRQRERHTQNLMFKEDENYKFYVTHPKMHIDKL